MKIFIFFTVFLISIVSFAQNRKTILSEINSYENRIIREASYQVTGDSLSAVLSNYFTQLDYVLDTISTDGVVYLKRLLCQGEQQFLDNNTKKRNSIYRDFFISIVYFQSNNKPLYLQIETGLIDSYTSVYEYNQAVLSLGTSSIAVSGKTPYCFDKGKLFGFNKMEARRFLYVHFYGNKIPFSDELNNKIAAYNASQKKEQKKIIAGRDY